MSWLNWMTGWFVADQMRDQETEEGWYGARDGCQRITTDPQVHAIVRASAVWASDIIATD